MSKAKTDQQQEILPNPKLYPPEQEVTFLTFGLDEQGHTLRLLVNGQHHQMCEKPRGSARGQEYSR